MKYDNKNNKDALGLFDLPKGHFRVKLDDNFREEIFGRLLVRFDSFSEVARQTGLKKGDNARRYYVGRSGMPLSFLIKVSELGGFSEHEMQKHVTEIKTLKSKLGIKNPKLPFDFSNPAFGLVAGGVLGDGGIEKRKCRVWYFNREQPQIDSFASAVKECFGDVEFARHRSIGGTPCIIFPKAIGLILKETGLIDGNKNYALGLGVPPVIVSGGETVKISLLKRLFDDDGTVINHHNCRCVSFVSPIIYSGISDNYKIPQISLDVKKLLQDFGVVSRIVVHGKNIKKTGEITVGWEIKVSRKENLQKFYDRIGFGLHRKQAKLKAVLERYVPDLESFPRFEAAESYLGKIALLQKNNVEVTSASLSRVCKRNSRHVREVLRGLFENGLIARKLIGRKFVYGVVSND